MMRKSKKRAGTVNCTPIVRHSLTIGGAVFSMTKYSFETKLEAVTAYLEETESIMNIDHLYNVNRSVLQRWIATFREHG